VERQELLQAEEHCRQLDERQNDQDDPDSRGEALVTVRVQVRGSVGKPEPPSRLSRQPALAIARWFAFTDGRVRLVLVGRFPLDPGAVAERNVVDRVAAPVRAG